MTDSHSKKPADAHGRHSRRQPAHGILIPPGETILVFLTVCTKGRKPWLISDGVHELLRSVWASADAWMVGRYLIMPDHIHLFAGYNNTAVPLDNWVKYWKSQFSKRHQDGSHRWQAGHWDVRLRREDSYDQKWRYVTENPVRHGLVARAEDWTLQDEINVIRWST